MESGSNASESGSGKKQKKIPFKRIKVREDEFRTPPSSPKQRSRSLRASESSFASIPSVRSRCDEFRVVHMYSSSSWLTARSVWRAAQSSTSSLIAAATEGNPTAVVVLWVLLAESQKVTPPSTSKRSHDAVEDLKLALRLRIPDAQVGMGLALQNGFSLVGEGMGKEEKKSAAVRMFRLAADQNSSDGYFHLGVCYINGKGVVTNARAAFQHFHKAAMLGHVSAQYTLSKLLELRGMHAESKLWLQAAAVGQHPRAAKELEVSKTQTNNAEKGNHVPVACQPTQPSAASALWRVDGQA